MRLFVAKLGLALAGSFCCTPLSWGQSALEYGTAAADWPACGLTAPGTNPSITFIPQSTTRIPGLDEYAVCIVAAKDTPLQLEGIRVVAEAWRRKIEAYTPAPLAKYIELFNERSSWRYGLLACEAIGFAATVPITSDLAEIKERALKVAIPAITAGCTVTHHVSNNAYKPVVIPRDLIQPLIAVPAGQVASYALWAMPQ